MTRRVIWMLSSMVLTACSWQGLVHHANQPLVAAKQTRVVAPFDQVRVVGTFDVSLHTGFRQDRVMIQTWSTRTPVIRTEVKDHILQVVCEDNCPKNRGMTLRIETRQLHSFSYQGKGDIIGQHLNTPYLNLSIDNPGRTMLGGSLGLKRVVLVGGWVTLTGVRTNALDLTIKRHARVQIAGRVRLAKLLLENDSWLSLYWLTADRLKLRAFGKTVIQFAGKARFLDLELWDRARFKGRYFKVNELFATTHDHAVAEINTLKHQHTLARDVSDIYFYEVPESREDFMAYNGAVLEMRLFNPKLKHHAYSAFNLSERRLGKSLNSSEDHPHYE